VCRWRICSDTWVSSNARFNTAHAYRCVHLCIASFAARRLLCADASAGHISALRMRRPAPTWPHVRTISKRTAPSFGVKVLTCSRRNCYKLPPCNGSLSAICCSFVAEGSSSASWFGNIDAGNKSPPGSPFSLSEHGVSACAHMRCAAGFAQHMARSFGVFPSTTRH
jgi:hypothetical protein